jgi:hypothetical protein
LYGSSAIGSLSSSPINLQANEGLKMKSKRYILPMLASILLILFVCFVAEEAHADWLTFRNTQFNFRFVYPSDWRLGTPRGPNVRGTINAPQNSPFANCSIVVRQLPETAKLTQKDINRNLDSEVWSRKDWVEILSPKFSDATIYEVKKIKVDNQPAQFATTLYPYETIQGKIYLKSINFITMTPGYFWHFGCAAGGSSQSEAQKNFQIWEPTFLRIFSSFVFER